MEKKPLIAIFITILLFSTIEVAVKLAGAGSIDPMLVAVLRFGIAGIVMVLLHSKKSKTIPRKDWFAMAGIGILGLGGTFGPYHMVLETSDASQVALIFSLNPVFASIVAVPLLKERISRNQIIALLLGFVGVYIVSFGFSPIEFHNVKDPLLMLWTAIAFGGYTTFNKRMVLKHGPIFTTGTAFIFAALALFPFVQTFEIENISRSIPILIYLIFFTTLIGYLLYFYGLKRVSVATGSSLFYLKPILATLLSVIILKETPQWQFYLGMVIIFSALFLSMKKRKS